MHKDPACENVPTGHATHAAALVAEPLGVALPVGQDTHAVEVPSMKYCPAPQHTAVPVGVQRLVWPWDAQVGEASAHEAKFVLAGPYAMTSFVSKPKLLELDAMLCPYTYLAGAVKPEVV